MDKRDYNTFSPSPILMMAAIKSNPNLTYSEYIKRYQPTMGFNTCCEQCNNYYCCSWAKGEPIDGWVAQNSYHEKFNSFKILHCPEFVEDAHIRRRYNDDGCAKLLEKIGADIYSNYADAIKTMQRYLPIVQRAYEDFRIDPDEPMYKDAISIFANALRQANSWRYQVYGIDNALALERNKLGYKQDEKLEKYVLRLTSAKKREDDF